MRHVLIAIPLLLTATFMIAQNPTIIQTTQSDSVATTVDSTRVRPVLYHMYSRSGRPMQYDLPKAVLAADTVKPKKQGLKRKAKKVNPKDLADK